ncbi:hypothetical protein BGX27_007259, partial [Mortierella sp. AM989]
MEDTKISCCLYADDVCLICRSPEELQRALDACASFSQNRHFRWKPAKSKVIAPKGQEHTTFQLYGQDLENVDTFTYLGIKFDTNGINIEAQLNHNINKAILTANTLRSLGCFPGGISPFLTATLYKTTIRPQMEYGLTI